MNNYRAPPQTDKAVTQGDVLNNTVKDEEPDEHFVKGEIGWLSLKNLFIAPTKDSYIGFLLPWAANAFAVALGVIMPLAQKIIIGSRVKLLLFLSVRPFLCSVLDGWTVIVIFLSIEYFAYLFGQSIWLSSSTQMAKCQSRDERIAAH